MTTTTKPAIVLGELLATDTATATRPAGPCAICSRGIINGDRFARLLTGKYAHTLCIGKAAGIAKGSRR
jgi:hypothetical protein